MTYECDMHTFYKGAPDAVVLPLRAEQVQAVVKLCRRARVPIVPRGSGTGLIGGAMAPQGGVMVSMTRMAAVLDVDLPNRCATVQPGLINLWLTHAVAERGWFFAPDPSSQMVSSIGGNVSTNAGGPHCLKYGITTNHVLGLEMVTGAGELVRLGGKAAERPGYDLTGAAVGSEGTFGLVTAITVRLTAHTGGGEDGAGRLPLHGRRLRGRVGDHRRRHDPRRPRDARRGHHQGDQRRDGRGLSGRRRRRAADRAGRPARGGRDAGRARRGDLPRARRDLGERRRATTPSARCCGRGARRRPARSGA